VPFSLYSQKYPPIPKSAWVSDMRLVPCPWQLTGGVPHGSGVIGGAGRTGTIKANAMTTARMRTTCLRLMPEIADLVGFTPTRENGLAILVGLD